jgi:hypothetical protein
VFEIEVIEVSGCGTIRSASDRIADVHIRAT